MKESVEAVLERKTNVLPTHDIKLFSGRSNTVLADEIAKYLGTSVGPMIIKNFSDGEIYVQIQDSIRGDDVLSFNLYATPLMKIWLSF